MVEDGTAEHGVQVILGALAVVLSDFPNERILSLDRGSRRDGGCQGNGRDPDHTGLVSHGGPELSIGGVFELDGGCGLQNLDLDRLGHSLEDLILGSGFQLDPVLPCIDNLLHGLHPAVRIFHVEDGLVPCRRDRYRLVSVDGVFDIEDELVLQVVTGVCRIGSRGDGDELGREISLEDLEISKDIEVPGLRIRLIFRRIGQCDRRLHRVGIVSGIYDVGRSLVQDGTVGKTDDGEDILIDQRNDLCTGILEPFLIDHHAVPLDGNIADTEPDILMRAEVLHPYFVEEAVFELVVGVY